MPGNPPAADGSKPKPAPNPGVCETPLASFLTSPLSAIVSSPSVASVSAVGSWPGAISYMLISLERSRTLAKISLQLTAGEHPAGPQLAAPNLLASV